MYIENNHDLNDSCVLITICSKEAFQVCIFKWKKKMCKMHCHKKKKNNNKGRKKSNWGWVSTKKNQATIYTYFQENIWN